MTHKSGPVRRWDEEGNTHVFADVSEVPAGMLDKHPAHAAELGEIANKKPSEPVPLTRSEMVAELTEGNIPFQKNASNAALYALLNKAVVNALTASGAEFDPSADVKTLLAVLKAPAE